MCSHYEIEKYAHVVLSPDHGRYLDPWLTSRSAEVEMDFFLICPPF